MDVTGWTFAQRMELPDWCFGTRQLIGTRVKNQVGGTYVYGISEIVFPDPICIWQVEIVLQTNNVAGSTVRIGLADLIPVNEAQMDAADEILPYFGIARAGPNQIVVYTLAGIHYSFNMRKAMVTDGKKLVISVYCAAGSVWVDVGLIVSPLPTRIPAHLDPRTV